MDKLLALKSKFAMCHTRNLLSVITIFLIGINYCVSFPYDPYEQNDNQWHVEENQGNIPIQHENEGNQFTNMDDYLSSVIPINTENLKDENQHSDYEDEFINDDSDLSDGVTSLYDSKGKDNVLEQPGFWEKLYKKLAKKWNYVEKKAQKIARAIDYKINHIYDKIRGKVPEVVNDFTNLLDNFGVYIKKGADYAIQKIAITFDDAKASQVITKLEEQFILGEKTVKDFFEMVGEEVDQWHKQKGYGKEHVDKTDFLHDGKIDEHFEDEEYKTLMKSPKICSQIQKLVDIHIITKPDGDVLCQQGNLDQVLTDDKIDINDGQEPTDDKNAYYPFTDSAEKGKPKIIKESSHSETSNPHTSIQKKDNPEKDTYGEEKIEPQENKYIPEEKYQVDNQVVEPGQYDDISKQDEKGQDNLTSSQKLPTNHHVQNHEIKFPKKW